MSAWVFSIRDYQGIFVSLSSTTWYKKAGNDEPGLHPEIRDYLVDIQQTIQSPDLVFQSRQDERSHIFYRLHAGREPVTGKHLVVIVKYVQEAIGVRGYVSTMYLSRSVYAKGAKIWQAKNPLLP